MLIYFLKVLFIYLKSLLLATFHFKGNKSLFLSGKNLTKRTFRIPRADYSKPLIVFTNLFSFAKNFLGTGDKNVQTDKSAGFIYDLRKSSQEMRQAYVKHFVKQAPGNFISKELLKNEFSIIEKVFVLLVYSLILFPYGFITLFSWNKAALSLIYAEVVENAALLKLVSRFGLKRCYFFSIYEKDSNIAAYLLMKNGVEVIKIPSEVPFYFFNTTIICDKLIICNAYQFDELKFYKPTIECKSTEMWGPERLMDVYDIYKAKDLSVTRNAIAFYSTASWVREKEGHMDQGTKMMENENLLLDYLKQYVLNHPALRLIIYAHPKEKKNINETQQYYKERLSGVNYEFADFNMPSATSFYKAELAVAFNSTLIHERLYFGFKTLILPLNHDGFPVEGSNFRNICAYSKEELFEKMEHSFKQTEAEFFKTNGIENYIFK